MLVALLTFATTCGDNHSTGLVLPSVAASYSGTATATAPEFVPARTGEIGNLVVEKGADTVTISGTLD